MQNPDDLHSRIQIHPGKRILDALQAYRFSKDIFAGKAIQLRLLVIQLEDIKDPLKIDGIEQHERLQALFSEVTRLFHNFLAGGKTLIDHTRNLMTEDFITEPHRSDYAERITRTFANEPVARFVQDVRNYMLHRAVPHVSLTEDLESEQKTLSLELKPMLFWSNWSPPARAFIEMHKPTVRILELIDSYEGLVKSSFEAFVLSFQSH